jgi:hypothetical protein
MTELVKRAPRHNKKGSSRATTGIADYFLMRSCEFLMMKGGARFTNCVTLSCSTPGGYKCKKYAEIGFIIYFVNRV